MIKLSVLLSKYSRKFFEYRDIIKDKVDVSSISRNDVLSNSPDFVRLVKSYLTKEYNDCSRYAAVVSVIMDKYKISYIVYEGMTDPTNRYTPNELDKITSANHVWVVSNYRIYESFKNFSHITHQANPKIIMES